MGDMAADFRALSQMRRTEKQQQLLGHARRLRWMESKGILKLRWMSPFHVRIWKASDPRCHMDFWPSSGKARGRIRGGEGGSTRGWAELMSALDVPDPFVEQAP